MVWKGCLRKDGRKGIRNKLLILYTVECASYVAKSVMQHFNHKDVEVGGFYGCTDNEYALRLINAMVKHPNVGGVLVIGLGCEYNQPSLISQVAQNAGKATDHFFIQEVGGTENAINLGIEKSKVLLKQMQTEENLVDMTWDDLIVGAECGGSDFTSGLAGNMIVGRFFDFLVDKKGTAIFEEIVEAIGLKDHLLERAEDQQSFDELSAVYDKAITYCKSVDQYSVSPGNFVGGLTTIEEKSMGAIIKSGSKNISGVLKVGEIPYKKGVWLLDTVPDPYYIQFGYTNPNDNEGLTALLASGAQLLFLVTGRGNVVGNIVSPVVKITGNSDTYQKMSSDMDFDAGQVLSGKLTVEELLESFIKLIEKICSGSPSCAELLGHKEYCIPYKYQYKVNRKNC